MKPRHDARLVPAALAAYACAGLASGEVLTPAGVRWVVAVAIGVCLVGLVGPVLAHRHRRRGGRGWLGGAGNPRSRAWLASLCAHAAMVGLMVAVVLVATAAHMAVRWDGGFHGAIESGPVGLVGVVVREPVPLAKPGFDGERRHRVALAVRQWRPQVDSEAWMTASATVQVIGGEDVAALAFGDHVTLATALSRVHGDRAVAIGWDAKVSDRSAATGIDGAVAVIRDDFRTSTSGLPEQVRGLSRGMVIGDTRAMPASQHDQMRVSGLTHLTAVSGAHFAVVAVLLHASLRRLRLHRSVQAGTAALGMVGFALLVFPDASVVRALVMALVGAVALWWGRPAQALPALATAVIVLVSLDPFIALEAGFALSVSAVAAIVLWAPRLRVLLGRVMPPTIAMLISVPLAAQAACAPILILLEPRVSVYAVLANALVAPFVAPVTIVGLAAVLAGPLAPGVASWGAWLASTTVWPVAAVAQWVASLPGTAISWPSGLAGALALAALTGVTMWWSAARGSASAKALATVLALALVVVTARADRAWEWTNPAPAQWNLAFCDVGQGDMMMLRVADHSAVVIDTGSGDGSAAACLRRYGVSDVPLLILTHPHSDHDGGVAEVLESVQVGAAWVPQVATAEGLDFAAHSLAEAGAAVTVPRVGQTWVGPGVEVTLRQARPAAPLPQPGRKIDGTVLNDASLVVSASVQDVTLLALGDVEYAAQADLVKALPGTLEVDVVKVPHHGSRVQDSTLAGRIKAAVAVVSVGSDNTYGHPADTALELYGGTGTSVFRTDWCADVVVWRDQGLHVASECLRRMAG